MKITQTVRLLVALVCLGCGSGCTSLAINNYIKEVRTNPSRATEPTPPTCTNGEDGKRAIIEAFKKTKRGEDVGGLRAATFLSLACLRTRTIAKTIGGGTPSQIYKAQVPIQERELSIMVEAWAQEPNEAYREAMALAFYDLDFATLHELYARLRERDVLIGTETRPLGNYYIIEDASENEIATIQKDWCQRLAAGDRAIFLSKPQSDESRELRELEERKLESFRGLIGNECDETDGALTEWVTQQDSFVTEILTALPDSADPLTAWGPARDKLEENRKAYAFPPTAELGTELARQGQRDDERLPRYLATIDKAQPSCAFVAELSLGFDALDDDTQAKLAPTLDAWEQAHLTRCQLEAWPE